MSFLKKHNIPVVRENYDVVYSAPLVPQMLEQENGGDSSTLERIFEIFNINRPDDFKGHSLSVSDVVVIVKDDNITPYYIDRVGSYQLNRDFIERSEVKDIVMAAQERAVNQSSRIVNKFFYNMAQSCRELAKKGSNKEEMLSKAKVYEFLATCTKEDIDNIYNSGVFNDMTEAFARKALFFQQVDYNTAGNIIAEIKSLHDMETISNVRTWNNTVNEKDWNDNIERNATASIRKDEYSM
ncbi:MAG: hypothetical protein IJ065_14890, partial [Eubacterium sp.]|nr:hypothetical protein [Eubacterium sp.]